MKWINDDKLTPYDLQVLNMMALAPEQFHLDQHRMYHLKLGEFSATMLGLGIQQHGHKLTPQYRRLSWRGQIKVRQVQLELLTAPLTGNEAAPPGELTANAAQASNLSQFAQALYSHHAAAGGFPYTGQAPSLKRGKLNPPTAPTTQTIMGLTVSELQARGFSQAEILATQKNLITGGIPPSFVDKLVASEP